MRKPQARCNSCAWQAAAVTRQDVTAMAREHQAAVQGHIVTIWIPEGRFFGWESYDMYPLPDLFYPLTVSDLVH